MITRLLNTARLRTVAILFALCAVAVSAPSVDAYAAPHPSRDELKTLIGAYLTTFNLNGSDRTGYDPYAYAWTGVHKLQTESTAMALWYAGNDDLGLTPTQLQNVYNFFAYMRDADGWLFSDYTAATGRVYKKFLHNAWSLAAIEVLEDNGIADSELLKIGIRDVLEGAINANGYIGGDPDGSEGLRVKAIQSLPFLFKVALDTDDTAAMAKARTAVDFYMANCIDASYDVWYITSTGSKTTKINTHEVCEFTHGLCLFYEYETDAARRSSLKSKILGILQRYTGAPWTLTNSYGEKYMSDGTSLGVNTLAQYQIQFLLSFAIRKNWMAPSVGADYMPVLARIHMAGTGDVQRDNNCYYQANENTGASISANINSYLPSYGIYAIETEPAYPGQVVFAGAGAVASGTGAITPALPSGIAVGDILLLCLETSNQAIAIANANGGTWGAVANSPQYTGTAAGSTGARLTVFWSRYNGTQGAPTTSDAGDHQLGRIAAFHGAVASGDPWDVTAGGVEATADATGAVPGATSTVDNSLVVAIMATALPDLAGTADFSAWTNSSLTGLVERTDNTVSAGNGGGLGIATGLKATAGAYGITSVSLASSSYKAMMSIALKPQVGDTHTLTYTAGANGSISGTTPQTVAHGGNGTQVTAVPAANHHFVKWSDDVLTAARTDLNVTADLAVTATFAIDPAGITVNPITGLTTTEAGGTAMFTVVLNTPPTADVNIGLSSSDLTEGTVAPASLTFTAANWNIAQTVTVTGVDDAVQDGDVGYTLVTAAATSADANYGGLDPDDVSATNSDDDLVPPVADPLRSTLTAAPLAVLADGLAASTLTATVLDGAGRPLSGKSVTFRSDRGASDPITPATATTNANGVATALIRSSLPGTATLSGFVDTDAVQIAQRATVAFTRGVALELAITPDRRTVEMGQAVRYTVALRNQGIAAITAFQVRVSAPPRFRYLPGSAMLGGVPAGDPPVGAVLAFEVPQLDGFVDADGDGRAGPGEPGYATLSVQLVPGVRAVPGTYETRAVAVEFCDSCAISNTAYATVTVEEATLFTRSTLLGRVFEDRNRDGRIGASEPGVPGAVVALDNGTFVTADTEGRFSVPDVEAGPHVVKLDVGSLSLPATVTTDGTQVINVSPGLLATVRFGVSFARDTARAGRPAIEGLIVSSEPLDDAIDVTGNALQGVLVVNGQAATVRSADARLGAGAAEDVLLLDEGRLKGDPVFEFEVVEPDRVVEWTLVLGSPAGDTLRRFGASGIPPTRLSWDGRLADGALVSGGEVYEYQLHVRWHDGTEATGPRRAFGVDRRTAISLTMTGDSFESGQTVLTNNARESLTRLARTIRRSPSEAIVIEGHTDSIGVAAENQRLSLVRAEAALEWLVRHERLPAESFVVEAWGERRPVASNATEQGRKLNRRIEIRGLGSHLERARLLDVWRGVASAEVAGLEVAVDSAGRFACRVPLVGRDTLDVALVDRRGARRTARVPLPALEIVEPRGEVRLPFGAEGGGVRVQPRAAAGNGVGLIASLDPWASEPVVAHAWLTCRTAPRNRVEVDGQPVTVGPDGALRHRLALHVGENSFGVVAREPGGGLRIANVVVRALDRDTEGRPAVVVERQPQLELHLPPPEATLTTPLLRLTGRTEPGHHVVVNGDTLEVRADGAFTSELSLPEGRSTLRAEAFDEAGHRTLIERELSVRSKRMFMVALADAVVGGGTGPTLVAAHDAGETWSEGRVAYYLKGWVAGRYLVTSAFDSRRREFRDLFRGLDAQASDRLLANLDPDRLYPVYGDSSAVMRDAPNPGRFYLGVESEQLHAAVGAFPVAFDDLELATFHRSLYGAQLRLSHGARSTGGAPPTSLALFGAENRHVPIRDELHATGGSLYYLSHSDVVEGSVQVSLVVRDPATGLVLARLPQQSGTDYTVKEREGRLLFASPVPSVWDDGAIVADSRLRGAPVLLEVNYESRGAAGDHAAAGARLRHALARWLAVGGTWLDDDSGAGAYRVRGADAELRLLRGTKLTGEWATSDGIATRTWASADGGLVWSLADTTKRLEGRAWKGTAEIDAGEWFGAPGRATAGGYFKRVEPGFASEALRGERGRDRLGLRTQLQAGRWGRLDARYDLDVRTDSTARDSGAVRGADLLGVQWSRDGKRAGFATEYRHRVQSFERAADQRASAGGARLWWSPAGRLRAALERQQSFNGPATDQTALGLELRVLPRLCLEARAADGSLGRSVRGGAKLSAGGRSIYVREDVTDAAGGRRRGTLFGVQAPLSPMSRVYSEYQWQRSGGAKQQVSVTGLEQGWKHASGTVLRVSGERAERGPAGSPGTRTTIASDLAYRGTAPLTGALRGEWRFDGPGGHDRQFVASTDVELRLVAGLSARGGWRLGRTQRESGATTPQWFEESRFGLSFRPRSDRVVALARWTRLADRRALSANNSTTSESVIGVAALEGTVRLTPLLEWSGKGAARVLRDANGGLPAARTHSALWIQRFDARVVHPVRVGVEYRALSQREVGDRLGGWLQEISWDPQPGLRFGVGYNFSRFSGDELARDMERMYGWFFRTQTRY